MPSSSTSGSHDRCILSPDLDPWEQQPDESTLWYSRFELFLALPAHNRRILKAYRQWADADNKQRVLEGKSEILRKMRTFPSSWDRQSIYWRWRERADLKERSDRTERQARHRQRLLELEEVEWKTGKALVDRAKEMVEYPLVTQTTSDDGKIIIIKPASWTAADAARYLSVGSEITRKAIGADVTADPLTALQVLVNEGWIPESILSEASEGIGDLSDRIRAAFESMGNNGNEPEPDDSDSSDSEENNVDD